MILMLNHTARGDSDDINMTYERGLPGIVMSCFDVFYYGSQYCASLDRSIGHAQTSAEAYNGQKDVKFSDNKYIVRGQCNP
ncbi:hypothetical protein SUGI_0234870 [Cryptomeria japonica]|nr:hypothetical protein SUGI_0234870 [Cryptomeria japonica]